MVYQRLHAETCLGGSEASAHTCQGSSGPRALDKPIVTPKIKTSL